MRCPKCGAKLRPSCPNCAAPIEPDWKVCPRCANELPETPSDVVIPVKRKDKSLSKILLVVILVPIVLLILMFVIFGMNMYTNVGSGGTSIAYVEAEQYLQDVNTDEITAWYENCNGGYSRLQARDQFQSVRNFHFRYKILASALSMLQVSIPNAHRTR